MDDGAAPNHTGAEAFGDTGVAAVRNVRATARSALVAAALAALAAVVAPAAGPAGAAGYVAPGRTAVASLMARAEEYARSRSGTQATGEHLHPFGRAVVVPDGHGGWITAIPAVRWPTADAYGQLVLFWHNRTFVGTSSLAAWPDLGQEAVQVAIVRAGVNTIVVKYAVYKPTDAMCCPSLPAVRIRYSWSGSKIVASAKVPAGAFVKGLSVRAS
jgi:hypothetical protein